MTFLGISSGIASSVRVNQRRVALGYVFATSSRARNSRSTTAAVRQVVARGNQPRNLPESARRSPPFGKGEKAQSTVLLRKWNDLDFSSRERRRPAGLNTYTTEDAAKIACFRHRNRSNVNANAGGTPAVPGRKILFMRHRVRPGS
jgi:hypothetical protein